MATYLKDFQMDEADYDEIAIELAEALSRTNNLETRVLYRIVADVVSTLVCAEYEEETDLVLLITPNATMNIICSDYSDGL